MLRTCEAVMWRGIDIPTSDRSAPTSIIYITTEICITEHYTSMIFIYTAIAFTCYVRVHITSCPPEPQGFPHKYSIIDSTLDTVIV